MEPRWKSYLLYAGAVIIGGSLLFILRETIRLGNTGFGTKTLWDWMELLVIPLVLAIGAFYLNRSERAIERTTAEERAKLEREIATDRQQEAALQSYLDRMADLLLEKNLRASENEEVRNVARIRTLTVLRGLDANRKGIVLRFLQEANLTTTEKAIIDLSDADLSHANLYSAQLSGINLTSAILVEAILRFADLSGANLTKTNLHHADLGAADLRGADLTGAHIARADLRTANLSNANLSGASLVGADLTHADLSSANLLGAELESLLYQTEREIEDLEGANQQDVKVYDEPLSTVYSLKGATMPDGTKHG